MKTVKSNFTTHAILDSILPRYLENTNPDVPAFHEAFADVVALLQRFSNTKLLEHQIEMDEGVQPSAAWGKSKPKVTDLYIEYEVRG
jgi:hypothetical protein